MSQLRSPRVGLMVFAMTFALLPQVAMARSATAVPGHPLPNDATGSRTVPVTSLQELKTALQQAAPGTVIAIAPGRYATGIFLKGVHGVAEAPVVIMGTDPVNPPVFSGQGEGAKLISCSYVRLANLVFEGFPRNGINIDDGGNQESPSHHIVLERITIRETGPKGNNDALKLSGVDHFIVRNCRFEGWGGSGIDLVGCHHGVVEDCRFIGKAGFRNANGIQIKGGSRQILVQTSTFRDAGERVIHIGGMTGLQYFRPLEADFEAREVTVAGNTFIGGEAQIAWITSRNSRVEHNLFYLPGKWVGRILQETKDPRFAPCRQGVFENNLVVVDERVKTFFNIGRGTEASSFIFKGNVWFRPGATHKPALPSSEKAGIYDLDPMIVMSPEGEPKVNAADLRLKKIGPWSYTPWRAEREFGDINLPAVTVPDAESSFMDRLRL